MIESFRYNNIKPNHILVCLKHTHMCTHYTTHTERETQTKLRTNEVDKPTKCGMWAEWEDGYYQKGRTVVLRDIGTGSR